MSFKTAFSLILAIGLVALLSACNTPSPAPDPSPTLLPVETGAPSPTRIVPSPTPLPPTPTLPPAPRLLTVCLAREPQNLFFYAANSAAARSVLTAVYDGPFDVQNFNNQPVILEELPSAANQGARLEAVAVSPGAPFVDAAGKLVTLTEGARYRPSGCTQASCALAYSGQQPVQMDQWVLTFHLKQGLLWADGAALTADDSLYSYEIAIALRPAAYQSLLERTASYLALDAQTLEWRGAPGYQDGDAAAKLFHPLPRHAWGASAPAELASLDMAARTPLGWGPYSIVQWDAGERILLKKNLAYWRSADGLPYFDNLIFRFAANPQTALEALLAGECDVLDPSATSEGMLERYTALQSAGKALVVQRPAALELLLFNLAPRDASSTLPFFASRETRQAALLCLDRAAIAAAAAFPLADGYIPAGDPLFNSAAALAAPDVKRAAELLNAAGWLDLDANPATPRTANGAAGIPAGTPFSITLLTAQEPDRLAAAKLIQSGLAQCGIGVQVQPQPMAEYLGAGPQGPVFGRTFTLAQLAWQTSATPPCGLYVSEQIPGSYPQAAYGWGGANAAGYSSAAFDLACAGGLNSLADDPAQKQAHFAAQELLAEDLPFIPLYWRPAYLAARPDLSGLKVDDSTQNVLWNVEEWNYADN